jgi:pSer/pThr/pTyr-binding forkhead associated (FHA) protein
LLEIEPPSVRIRDLGSRNGTYVNGVLIGRRDPELQSEPVPVDDLPAYDVRAGDQLQVGATVFDIDIVENGTDHETQSAGEMIMN